MSNPNFELASRLKLRFNTERGSLTAEDLWDLPLTSATKIDLNGIAKELSRKLREDQEEDFVQRKPKNEYDTLGFEIVKHIIEVRLAEAEEKKKAEENQRKRDLIDELIDELIESKKHQDLVAKAIEELQAEHDDLAQA